MSLIADALKAAQHEKMRRMPAPAGSPPGFFSVRSRPKADAIPRSLVYILGAAGAVVGVSALVVLLSASRRSAAVAPPTVEQPASNPVNPSPPQASLSVPVSNPTPVATDSAQATPVAASRTAEPNPRPLPAPTAVADQTAVSSPGRDLGARKGGAADSARVARGDSASTIAGVTAPRPAGTFKILMEQRPGPDIRQIFQEALAAQRRGDLATARQLYLKAQQIDPRNAELDNNLGTLFRATGELDRAEESYKQAIAIDPRLAAAWSNLGVLLDARGKKQEAIAALQEALSIDPSNADTKVNLALQYHAAGAYPEAKRLLEDALRINPTMPEAQYALGRTLEALGDRAGAIQRYESFLASSGGRFPVLETQVRQHLAMLRGGA